MKQPGRAKPLRIIKESASRTSLTLILAIFVFVILLSAIGLTAIATYVMSIAGVFVDVNGESDLGSIILAMSLVSVVIGGIIAFFSSKLPLKPINNLINKMNRLASGDFKARLDFGTTLSSHPAFKEISTSFNTMAKELENTEMLRTDFINNFSHEFKTPIVSITGFAKLLAKGNLTEEQRMSYLHSIEEESMRLSSMATNVLRLSHVESQTILTDPTVFNVSEQLRSSVLLLEEKWEKKRIDLQLDFDEYKIEASEELLKEVWINLIDNAIKFAPEGGTLALDIQDRGNRLAVSIGNTGHEIPSAMREKIFTKFYQGDESHATQGNGIGLAIVKRIVTLHKGTVTADYRDGMTVFTVTLPKEQGFIE